MTFCLLCGFCSRVGASLQSGLTFTCLCDTRLTKFVTAGWLTGATRLQGLRETEINSKQEIKRNFTSFLFGAIWIVAQSESKQQLGELFSMSKNKKGIFFPHMSSIHIYTKFIAKYLISMLNT